jgi:iron complex transport system permease protein
MNWTASTATSPIQHGTPVPLHMWWKAPRTFLGILAGFAIMSVVTGITIGPVGIALTEAVRIVAAQIGLIESSGVPLAKEAALISIRLPRVVAGLFVGAILGMAGAAMQGFFRNPLADPALIGVSSGGACGALTAIVMAPSGAEHWAVPGCAMAGAAGVAAFVYRLAGGSSGVDATILLLAGIAVNTLAAAYVAFLLTWTSDQQMRSFQFWLLGSLNGVTWTHSLLLAVAAGLAASVYFHCMRALDALLLGEGEAYCLGIPLRLVKRRLIAATALSVGVTVALCGMIGFVGLVVPHLIRLVTGASHRWVIPGAALFGAGLLTLSDAAARTVVAPAELPIGIFTASIGAPFFLALIYRQKRQFQ